MDVGTGDGLFVYKSAQRDPRTFYIGIDANRRPLEKISEKIHRRPDKGGLSNVLYVQASVEDLPAELDAIAAEVFVQFPWGSLLRGVAGGDETVLGNLRRLCYRKLDSTSRWALTINAIVTSGKGWSCRESLVNMLELFSQEGIGMRDSE